MEDRPVLTLKKGRYLSGRLLDIAVAVREIVVMLLSFGLIATTEYGPPMAVRVRMADGIKFKVRTPRDSDRAMLLLHEMQVDACRLSYSQFLNKWRDDS